MNFLNQTPGPRIFRYPPGCGPCGGSPLGGSPIIPVPASCAAVCDERYFSLQWLSAVKLLGVQNQGQCQAYLKAFLGADGNFYGGFVFMGADGLAYVTRQPFLTLPLLNPPTAGNYPATPTFRVLFGSGGDPAGADIGWNGIVAPTVGNWLLISENGLWRLSDAGTIPGLNAVCEAGITAGVVNLMGCADVSEAQDGSEFAARKLTTGGTSGRIVVSFVPVSGVSGHRLLPLDEPLTHPIAEFGTVKVEILVMVDEDGVEVPGGFPVDVRVPDADAVLVSYSPTSKKLYRKALPWYKTDTFINTANMPGGGPPASFGNLPGGHGVSSVALINYPNVMITWMVDLSDQENVDFALFRDGTQIQVYNYGIVKGHAGHSFVDTNVPVGNHVYDVRYKEGSGINTGTGKIRGSSITVATLLS